MPKTLPTAPATGSTFDTSNDRYIWSGSSWNLLPSTNARSQYSEWSAKAAVTITATTTAPTKPNIAGIALDFVRYRSVGFKTYEVEYKYAHTSAGTAGSGDYLFELPGGLSFDSTYQFFTAAIGQPGQSSLAVPSAYATAIHWGTNNARLVLLPYTSTRFRLWAYLDTTGNRPMVSSSLLSLASANIAYNINFKFTAA